MDRTKNNSPQTISFFNSLNRYNLFDAFTVLHDTNRSSFTTFHRNQSCSHIDYIWMTSELTLNLLDASVLPVDEYVSDHHVVNIKCINFLDIKSNDRKCPLKISYNFNKMDEKNGPNLETNLIIQLTV